MDDVHMSSETEEDDRKWIEIDVLTPEGQKLFMERIRTLESAGRRGWKPRTKVAPWKKEELEKKGV